MQRVDNNAFIQKYGAMIVLVFIVVINMFITPNFTQINTFWNIIIQAFPVIIVSIGMTLVISTGGIDISVGSTVAIAAIVFAKMLVLNGMSLGVSIIIAMVACTAFGMINGFLIGMFRVQPIVATLILMISGRGIAQQLNDGAVISFYGNPYVDIRITSYNVCYTKLLRNALDKNKTTIYTIETYYAFNVVYRSIINCRNEIILI